MYSETDQIIEMIKKLRNKLEELLTKNGIIDAEVLAASKILDAALNEYYKLLKEKT